MIKDNRFSVTIEAATMNALQDKRISTAINHDLNERLYNEFAKQGLQTAFPLVLYAPTGVMIEVHIGAEYWLRIDDASYKALQKKTPFTSFATFRVEHTTMQNNPLTYNQKNLFTAILEEYCAIISKDIREYDAKNTLRTQ